MDFTDERDDDDLTGDDDLSVYRDRAKAKLKDVARDVRQALDEQGIGSDIPVFFLAPNSGDAVVLFGTVAEDPTDDDWRRVSDVVTSIVQQAVGLDAVRCREVVCAATTDVVTGNEHLSGTSSGFWPDGDLPMPTQMAASPAGVETR